MRHMNLFVSVVMLSAVNATTALEQKNFDISEVRNNDKVYKIHGDNGGDEKYKCHSFESELDVKAQKYAVEHSKLAAYSYQDGESAYRNESGQVTRDNALSQSNYSPMSSKEVNEYIKGSGLEVRADGSVGNPNDKNGLSAVLLKGPGNEIVISYRGTSSKSNGRDIVDDATQAAVAKLVPQQYKDSALLLRSVIANTSKDTKIVCDGHSLGGGEVTYAMAATDLSGRDVTGNTYNAAGLSESTIESLDAKNVAAAADRIVNYRNSRDPVSYPGYHIGKTYEITTSANYSDNKHTVKNDHSLAHMTENMMAVVQNETGKPYPHPTTATQDSANPVNSIEQKSSDANNRIAASDTGVQQKVDTDSLYGAMGQEHPSESTSNQELANEKFGEMAESITGDKNLAQKIKDLVTSKIDEAIKKGEEWVENGGIRDEIKKQVEKAVDGKVSEEDKQRILNLTDKLCNVKDDGGKSLVEALGTDGKDLAASLAVNEIKKQISSALPKDVADNVNAMIDAIAATGSLTDPAVKQKLLESVQSAVKEYLPYENSANTINNLLQQIADGKGIDVIDAAKDLGKAIGIDALKAAISKNLDPAAAARVNALIDGYTKNGVEGLTDAALAEINAAIDKYAPGADSAAALKDVLQSMKDGTITADKIKDAVKAVGVDGAKALIDKSNLSDDAKKAAKEAVDAVAKDGWSGLTDTAKKYIEQYVTDKLGEEAGKAIGNIFDAITTPGADVWDAIDKNGPIIGEAIFNKVAEKFETWAQKQIDKLIGKNPFLKELFGRLGIDGKSIVAGIKNIWGVLKEKGFSGLFEALSQQALAWFKSAAAKLIDWGVEKLCDLANQVIGRVLDWLSGLLGKAAAATDWGALNKLLLKLQAQLDAAKTNGTIKVKVGGVGQKAVDWFEGKMKKSSGTEKAKGKFD